MITFAYINKTNIMWKTIFIIVIFNNYSNTQLFYMPKTFDIFETVAFNLGKEL
jgi:hypothetical protein